MIWLRALAQAAVDHTSSDRQAEGGHGRVPVIHGHPVPGAEDQY